MTEANPQNIWGKPGCELPNGGLCQACCYLFEIPELKKPATSPCPFQTEEGCEIYELKPERCSNYHCSRSPQTTKNLLQVTAEIHDS